MHRCQSSLPAQSRSRAVLSVRASHGGFERQVVAVIKKAALASLSVAVAASSLAAAPPANAASSVTAAAAALEKQQLIEQQKRMHEFMIEQQYNAAKAKVAAERSQLQKEKAEAEALIESQVVKEQAFLESALAAQDQQKEVEVAEAALARLEKQEEAVEVTAERIGAVIDREEVLAAASKEEALQKVDTQADQEEAPISKAVNSFLEPFLAAASADSTGEAALVTEATALSPEASDSTTDPLAASADSLTEATLTPADSVPEAPQVTPEIAAADADAIGAGAVATGEGVLTPVPVFDTPVAYREPAASGEPAPVAEVADALEQQQQQQQGMMRGAAEVAQVADSEGGFSIVVEDSEVAVVEEAMDEESKARQEYCDALEKNPEYGLDCMNCEC